MEEKTGPPQPILIQATADTEPETVKAEPQNAVSTAARTNAMGGVSQEAIDHYRLTLSTKPNIVGLLVLGVLLLFVVPLTLLEDVFYDDDAAGFCCFSVITGIVLVLVASTKDNAWRKEIKLAKARVINEGGLKAPAVSKTPRLAAGGFLLASVFARNILLTYGDLVSAALFIAAAISLVVFLAKDAEANKIVERNLQAVLNQVEEEG